MAKKIEMFCDNCGGGFFKYQCQVKGSAKKFCSRKCHGESLVKPRIGRKCRECSGVFLGGKLSAKYCSPICQRAAQSKKRVLRVCATCSKGFYGTKRKYCSKECYRPKKGEDSGKWKGGKYQTHKRQVEKFPAKRSAVQGVYWALRRGKLSRPENCESCHAVGRLDAHHDDYQKKLEVRWLCRKCHLSYHKELRNLGWAD